jgi:hypothetical protein
MASTGAPLRRQSVTSSKYVPVFIEEMVNKITRLSRKPVIKNAKDATACYDRIVPGVGNIASRAHGLHCTIALVQGTTLAKVKYHLKMQLGVTDDFLSTLYHFSYLGPSYCNKSTTIENTTNIWVFRNHYQFWSFVLSANLL